MTKPNHNTNALKKLHDKRDDGVKLNRKDRRALKKLERVLKIVPANPER